MHLRRLALLPVLLCALVLPATALARSAAKHRRPAHHATARHHRRRRVIKAAPRIPVARATSAGTAATLPVSLRAVPAITGTTYYVSPSGSDQNSGLSPAQPWRTVNRVNGAHLQPGDGVLFQGGQTFSDAVLMPLASGSSSRPIVFGSYGAGPATITQGAWFVQSHLAFENLAFDATFYGGSEVHGQSSDILLDHVQIAPPSGNGTLGLYTNGDDWTIQNSHITGTGLSGMLLNGDSYLVADNTIAHTGLDTSVGYNNHGIYLDASNATIEGNTITDFAESGVSVRYRNSVIVANDIERGNIGIDFFQTDPVAGAATWRGNTIAGTTAAAVYVSPSGSGGNTKESFTITGNRLHPAAGVLLNLHPTTGTYTVADNPSS